MGTQTEQGQGQRRLCCKENKTLYMQAKRMALLLTPVN
jgi:hypothetical protein